MTDWQRITGITPVTTMDVLPEGEHEGLLYIYSGITGEWIMLARSVNITREGVWTWTGLWRDALVRQLEPGLTIECYRPNTFTKMEATVTKVNRVSFQCMDADSNTYTIRIEQ